MDLLGFDIMLDHKLKPWLLEVNSMPSFRADTAIDYDIKHNMLKNMMQITQLNIEWRHQMEKILKQEARNALVTGQRRRMTAREHCERVRFDYSLVDRYVPNNKFKRIYPLDASLAGSAENGDDLGELYSKLEKSSTIIWKKIAGMMNHKQEEKKKVVRKRRIILREGGEVLKKKAKKVPKEEDDEAVEICEEGQEPDDESI